MSWFTDVIQKDPRYHSAERCADLALLEPIFRQKVQAVITEAKAHGVPVMVYETFRSQARQEELFNQGATELQHVGVHGYGLAADIVRVVNGEPSWDGDFSMIGHLAHCHLLITGQDWGRPGIHHSFMDAPHVQRISVADQDKLFHGDWYPDTAYNPYQHL